MDWMNPKPISSYFLFKGGWKAEVFRTPAKGTLETHRMDSEKNLGSVLL
jgi:hypothetical protein